MSPNQHDLCLFALAASETFADAIARRLGADLQPLELRAFEDAEHKIRPLVSVRGRDVFVLAALHGEPDASVNDKLCRLFFFMAALRDAGAAGITVVIPYMVYARKDRRTKLRDPVSSRYLAELLEAAGARCVVTLDVHNIAAFENAFRCPSVHLEAKVLLARHYARQLRAQPITAMSPDLGGAKRVELFRDELHEVTGTLPGFAITEKQRSAGVVSGDLLAGDVEGRQIIIVDDLVSGGTTLNRAAKALRQAGAAGVHAAITHGLFSTGAEEKLREGHLDTITITDSIHPPRIEPDRLPGLTILETAPLFAAAIRAIHEDRSIEALISEEISNVGG